MKWSKMLLELERYTPGYRAPVSARMFAYASLAAYESVLPANPPYRSLSATFTGYTAPTHPDTTVPFSAASSLNAAYALIARRFFPTAPGHLLRQVDQLEAQIAATLEAYCDTLTCASSRQYGLAVAEAVWKWSATDTTGHNGCFYCFERDYKVAVCEGCWRPDPDRPIPPLLPQWGKARPFLGPLSDLSVQEPPPFDETPGSYWYNQAMEVFAISQSMSKDNQWISEFWSDDIAGLTITPAGRWISIANQAIEQECPAYQQVLEVHLRTSLALCDALIHCWALKYQFNRERPRTYINDVIQPEWRPYMEDPSFPGYPAGHAMLSAAAAEVLSAQFGEPYELTDRTHQGRQEFAGMPRTFHSFQEMARENALSRLLAGVHFRMDCDEGMRLGQEIGKKAVALPLK